MEETLALCILTGSLETIGRSSCARYYRMELSNILLLCRLTLDMELWNMNLDSLIWIFMDCDLYSHIFRNILFQVYCVDV